VAVVVPPALMESLVLSYLRKYFAVVLRNFDAKRDFHLNLSKGEVTVSNLRTFFFPPPLCEPTESI